MYGTSNDSSLESEACAFVATAPRRLRKVKIDAPSRGSVSLASDSENPEMSESPRQQDGLPRHECYERLVDEHVDAVVILKNDYQTDERWADGHSVESLPKSGGKLTFNLTPEQLGCTGIPVQAAPGEMRKLSAISSAGSAEAPRKSSLRRSSLYSNQSDLEKQYVMEQPQPVPERSGLLYDEPRKTVLPACGDGLVDDRGSHNRTVYDQFPTDFLPSRYTCGLCKKLLCEPRVLDCLHTFCKGCLVDAAAATHTNSSLFWRGINDSTNFEWDISSDRSVMDVNAGSSEEATNIGSVSRFDQLRASLLSFKENNCLRSPVNLEKHRDKQKAKVTYGDKEKILSCPTCNHPTDVPLGGVNRLPQHFVLARKIENLVAQCDNLPASGFCELCSAEVKATASCATCAVQLCTFCREAHQRQRSTATHPVRTLVDSMTGSRRDDIEPRSIKCPLHPEHQLNLFCTSCHQVMCGECTVHLHRDHRHTSVARAARVYGKLVRNAIEQTKPLEDYALQSVGKLNDLTIRINGKCETVERDVESFVDEYVAALEEHRKALRKQIGSVREAKMAMIMAQKLDLEQRSESARVAIEFAEELTADGSDIENLVFVSILLKRFERCLRSNKALDLKVTDTVEFLAEERAPSAGLQNRTPLYGIVTTQKADPRKCALENATELTGLRVHRKVQLTLVTKDFEGLRMNHGGISVQTDLRYRDEHGRAIPMNTVDNGNGTYGLSFVPERSGVLQLVICVDGKTIQPCPVVLTVQNLRTHAGIFHCCAFCSSNGSKYSACACGSVMPGGYRGCGHGHEGHPGQRHWSCCASLEEHSDCSATGRRLC